MSNVPILRSTTSLCRSCISTSSIRFRTNLRAFSVLNRPPPNYEGHVPLTRIERAALAVGSAVTCLVNPRREGMLFFTVHTAFNFN